MNKKILVLSIVLLCLKLLNAQDKPNIVLLYIDDWAWNGSPIQMDESMENSGMPVLQMPNLEKLAQAGMKFGNAFGSPQCAPARVCVQTGQSSPHNGYTVVLGKINDDYYDMRKAYSYMPLIPNISDTELDTSSVTIAEALNPLGYNSAHFGKWHMYNDPGLHGYIAHDGDTNNNPGSTLKANTKPGEKEPTRIPDDLTDPKLMFSITEKAVGFMEEQVAANRPFYLQLSHYGMHEWRECLPATREKYAKHPLVQEYYKKRNTSAEAINYKHDPAVWLGMGEDLDGRIGALLDRIDELGIADNTYVIVVSDNGYRHDFLPGLTQPLHGKKWWVWNGGIRVPMVVKGPGIKPGSDFKGNVINYDFLPTFVDWAGGDWKKLQDIDGVSLAAYMAGEKPDETFLNRNLYFHYPHYRESVPHSAIISGSSKVMHFYEKPNTPMLFDLSGDPGEVKNIAKQFPEKHQKLHNDMMRYFMEVGVRFPKENPDYDAEEYQKDKKTVYRLKWGPFEGTRLLDDDEI